MSKSSDFLAAGKLMPSIASRPDPASPPTVGRDCPSKLEKLARRGCLVGVGDSTEKLECIVLSAESSASLVVRIEVGEMKLGPLETLAAEVLDDDPPPLPPPKRPTRRLPNAAVLDVDPVDDE